MDVLFLWTMQSSKAIMVVECQLQEDLLNQKMTADLLIQG